MSLLDLKALALAIEQIEGERGISRDELINAISKSLASAYKKEYGKLGQIVDAHFDSKTGDTIFEQIKIVVEKTSDEEGALVSFNAEEEPVTFNSEKHILVSDAKKIKSDAIIGDEIRFPLPPKSDFGRIAAQTAKQVIKQKLREAERNVISQEYQGKEGQLVTGSVRRIEKRNVYIDVDKVIAVLPFNEQIRGERYKQGELITSYISKVDQDNRSGEFIVLSRKAKEFVVKLFERESPEVANGTVVIKSISRDAGKRSKIAVESKDEYLDPVGALVGQRGVRVSTVSSELRGERLDIIPYTSKVEAFIEEAMQPAEIVSIEIENEEEKQAKVYVREEQMPIAIGNKGINIRLASQLTGWNLDVVSVDTGKSASEEDAENLELSDEVGKDDAPKESEEIEEKNEEVETPNEVENADEQTTEESEKVEEPKEETTEVEKGVQDAETSEEEPEAKEEK